MASDLPTVGILYPGELGTALGRLLADRGVPVVTTVHGRSARTRQLAREAGFEVLGSLSAVKQQAEVVLSLVPPAAAESMAEAYRAALPRATGRLFVDVNSVSPATVSRVAERLQGAGIECADATVTGLAGQLRQRGALYVSGPGAARVAELFEGQLRTRVLGPRVGEASALKMVVGGLSKGLSALFVELSLLAREAGILDDVVEEYDRLYPAVMEVVARMLPTYPLHAARRGQELGEVSRTMEAHGLTPTMVRAARELTTALGQLELGDSPDGQRPWTTRSVVDAVAAAHPLGGRVPRRTRPKAS